MRVWVSILATAMFFSACGEKSESNLKDVSTPGIRGQINNLLWVKDGTLHFGSCPLNLFPSRESCQSSYSSSAKSIKTRLLSPKTTELDDSEKQFAEEEKKLKNEHPLVAPHFQKLMQLDDDLQSERLSQVEIVTLIAKLTETLAELNNYLVEVKVQINAVSKKLQDKPEDKALVQLLQFLLTEKVQIEQEIEDNQDSLKENNDKEKAVSETIADLENQRISVEGLYIVNFNSVQVENGKTKSLKSKIETLTQEIKDIAVMMTKAEDGLVFRHSLLTAGQKIAFRHIVSELTAVSLVNGHLKIRIDDQWRPVCSSGFTEEQAKTTCRHLGGSYTSWSYSSRVRTDHVSLSNKCSYRGTLKDCVGDDPILVSCYSSYYGSVTLQCSFL